MRSNSRLGNLLAISAVISCLSSLTFGLTKNMPLKVNTDNGSDEAALVRLRRATCHSVDYCRNGGLCNPLGSDPPCICPVPYVLPDCSGITDHCTQDAVDLNIIQPVCKNGGTCTGTISTKPYYHCNCVSGYSDSDCSRNTDDCASKPCTNGVCTDGLDSYSCSCFAGWEGSNCDIDHNDCPTTETCINGGRCLDRNRTYSCDCSNTGFTGSRCELNIDDCASKPCVQGLCTDLVKDFNCSCFAGWEGKTCSVDTDYCLSAPCLNDGKCSDRNLTFNCNCLGTDYQGPTCNSWINDCEPSPCLNMGRCTDGVRNYSCNCADTGFYGRNCSLNIDDCASKPCIQGLCTDLVKDFSCSCYQGWEGKNCSVDRNDCFAGACLNGGKCIDGNASYTCNCSDTGFYGTNCSLNIDDCALNPCVNGGSCTDGVKNYSCNCLPGYSGRNCTADIPDCSPNPCMYNGSCLERSNQALYGNASLPQPFNGSFSYALAAGYVCLCPLGSYGSNCSINPDDCVVPGTNQSVCVHASGCTDGLNDFTCNCLPGYDAKNCSYDIDECALFGQPCSIGSTCQDLVADYACNNCPAGFAGKNCSTEFKGCQPSKCQNGAECQPILVSELPIAIHDYRCICKLGWSDRNCNTSTLASFNGSNSFLVFLGSSSSLGDWVLEMTFRSTLTRFDLAQVSSDWGIIRIGAFNSNLVLQLLNVSSLNSSSVISQASWPIGGSLASADWLTLSIVLSNESAKLSPTGSASNQSMLIVGLARMFRRSRLSIRVGVSTTDVDSSFRGCVADLRLLVNNATFVARESSIESGNVTWGVCDRSPQCGSPSPCQSNTSLTCSDLWNDFVCTCTSDFGGRNCSVQLPSFTFGLDGNVSSASFSSLPAASNAYGTDDMWTIEMKLLTLSPGAFLLMLGDPKDDSATVASPRLIATLTPSGQVSAQLVHGNGSQIAGLQSSDSVATGSFVSVKISVTISGRIMSLTVSSSVSSASFSNVSSLSPLTGSLMIGGFSGASAAPAPTLATSSVGRSKRSAPALPSSVASSLPLGITGFRGILSSARLNEARPLILGAVSSSLIDSLPGALSASDATAVVSGTVTEKVCAAFSPCMNGGTCTDVLYNKYFCQCPIGWMGVSCTIKDNCYAGSTACPSVSACFNLDSGGFECRTAATFGSYRQPSPANRIDLSVAGVNEPLATVSGWVRTRQSDCQLVSVSSGPRQLSVKCNSTYLQASLDDQIALSPVSIATGVPFTFSVSCSPGSPLRVSVNGSDAIVASSSSAIATALTLDSVATVTLGGFKGCLNEVRINGYLAPLVNRTLESGAKGFYWSVSQSSAPMIGCYGDPVCQATEASNTSGVSSGKCLNSGKCTDLWNAFTCECLSGFQGSTCEQVLLTTPIFPASGIAGICIATIILIGIVIAAVMLARHFQSKPFAMERGINGPYVDDDDGGFRQAGLAPSQEERLV